MKLEMERVIHPTWVTRMFTGDASGEWMITHTCQICGQVFAHTSMEANLYWRNHVTVGSLFWDHTFFAHRKDSFNLAIHEFRGSLDVQNPVWGLQILEWPDRLPKEFDSLRNFRTGQ
jgi:hypothetical protein